jgi:HD-GYP domain-containing protein (c-di-GMP phosphodiesterase class II)
MMSGAEDEQYFAVARDLIAANVQTGMDLYVHVQRRYVLYRSGTQPLDPQGLRKLMRLQVDTLYVQRSQSEAFKAYLARNAATLLKQAETRDQEIEILRGAAHGALSTALKRLDDPAAYERVRTVSDLTVDSITADIDLMSSLVQFVKGDERLLTHSLNVAAYSIALGARHGLDERDLHTLGLGAMLHDVGVSAVDEEIMGKGEPLTDVERDFIARHPRRGREILEAASIDDPLVLDIVLQHHGRVGREPLTRHAQIVRLADAFDSLTNEPAEPGHTGPFAALYHMRSPTSDDHPPELLRDFVLLLGGVQVLDANSPIAPLSRHQVRQVALAG